MSSYIWQCMFLIGLDPQDQVAESFFAPLMVRSILLRWPVLLAFCFVGRCCSMSDVDEDIVMVASKEGVTRQNSDHSSDMESRFQAFTKKLRNEKRDGVTAEQELIDNRRAEKSRATMTPSPSPERSRPQNRPRMESSRDRPRMERSRERHGDRLAPERAPERHPSARGLVSEHTGRAVVRGRASEHAGCAAVRGRSVPVDVGRREKESPPRRSMSAPVKRVCTVCGDPIEDWEEPFKWYCEHKDCGLAKRACERYCDRNKESVNTTL